MVQCCSPIVCPVLDGEISKKKNAVHVIYGVSLSFPNVMGHKRHSAFYVAGF